MATLSTPSSAFNSVKVNVRLCGSVPRKELETLSLTKCIPPSVLFSRTPNTNSYLKGRDDNSSSCDKIEESPVGSQPNYTSHEERKLYRHALPRLALPEFEAPSWAVPATGESRLEVSTKSRRASSFFDGFFLN